MKQFLIGSLIGMASGLVVGGIVVARNKKLSHKINEGLDCAEEKIKDAKAAIEKKLKNCKNNDDNKNNCESDSNSNVCC